LLVQGVGLLIVLNSTVYIKAVVLSNYRLLFSRCVSKKKHTYVNLGHFSTQECLHHTDLQTAAQNVPLEAVKQ